MISHLVFTWEQNENRPDPRGEQCHAKTMMSRKDYEELKIDTQHVQLRQSAEEKVRGKYFTIAKVVDSHHPQNIQYRT